MKWLLTFAFLVAWCWNLCAAELACSVTDEQEVQDPNLKEMTYDIGYGEEKFLAYVEPDVKSFYQGTPPPASTKGSSLMNQSCFCLCVHHL